jgi:acyl-CoA thioester hydrolase
VRRNRWTKPSERYLESTTQVRVRFQEVDALRVVWHGHYLSYFEEGRTAFGREFGLGYQDVLDAGFIAPLVHLSIDYLAPTHLDELVTITSRLHQTASATIPFTYIVSDETGRELATGFSVQAFTNTSGELVLTRPAFYSAFLERYESRLTETAGR